MGRPKPISRPNGLALPFMLLPVGAAGYSEGRISGSFETLFFVIPYPRSGPVAYLLLVICIRELWQVSWLRTWRGDLRN